MGLGHIKRRGVVSLLVGSDADFNILIEFNEAAQETLDRELPDLAAQHLEYVGLANAE